MNDDNIYKIDEFSKFGRFSVKSLMLGRKEIIRNKPKL